MKTATRLLFAALILSAACKVSHPATTPPPPVTTAPPTPAPAPRPKTMGLVKPELMKQGYASMTDYIQKNVQYPDAAKKNNISGTVMVTATVDTLGMLNDVKAENDPGYGMAAAAVQVVKSMSPMTPASNNGNYIRFHMKLPVVFQANKPFTADSEEVLEKMYGQMPDIEAQYPGGVSARDAYIQANFKVPNAMSVGGTIYVAADIETDGTVDNVRVVRESITDLDPEAIRVIKSMPKWTPASTLGHPVKSTVVIAVEVKQK